MITPNANGVEAGQPMQPVENCRRLLGPWQENLVVLEQRRDLLVTEGGVDLHRTGLIFRDVVFSIITPHSTDTTNAAMSGDVAQLRRASRSQCEGREFD